jgi:molecular chaperone HscB
MISEAAASRAGIVVGLDASDFELFELPARFTQDRAAIDARWRSLMAQMHPDRFAFASVAEQCEAMQWSLRLNQAYERLKQPLERAAYLCELNGQAIDAETNTAMPREFLLQQMAWQETLAESRTPDAVQALADAVAACRQRVVDALGPLLDERADWVGAAAQVRALMFLGHFEQQLERRIEGLETPGGA